MPVYNATVGAQAIYPGDQVLAFGTTPVPCQSSPPINPVGESLVVATASKQFSIPINPSQTDEPTTLAVELTFSATPGVFRIDVQRADTDAAANYITIQQISTTSATFVSSNEFQVKASFIRLVPVTWPNAVTCIAKITR